MYGGRSQNSSRFQLTVHNHRNWRRETLAQSTPPTTESIKREGKKKANLRRDAARGITLPAHPHFPPRLTAGCLKQVRACTRRRPLFVIPSPSRTRNALAVSGPDIFSPFFSGNSLGFPIGEATGPRFFCFFIIVYWRRFGTVHARVSWERRYGERAQRRSLFSGERRASCAHAVPRVFAARARLSCFFRRRGPPPENSWQPRHRQFFVRRAFSIYSFPHTGLGGSGGATRGRGMGGKELICFFSEIGRGAFARWGDVLSLGPRPPPSEPSCLSSLKQP